MSTPPVLDFLCGHLSQPSDPLLLVQSSELVSCRLPCWCHQKGLSLIEDRGMGDPTGGPWRAQKTGAHSGDLRQSALGVFEGSLGGRSFPFWQNPVYPSVMHRWALSALWLQLGVGSGGRYDWTSPDPWTHLFSPLQGTLQKSLEHLRKQMEDALMFQAQAEETLSLWQASGGPQSPAGPWGRWEAAR